MSDVDDVIITSEASKLPPDVAALLDPAVPLPDGVAFFEKRFDVSDMVVTLVVAMGLAVAALFLVSFGVYALFDRSGPVTVYSSGTVDYLPLTFGAVCALAAWIMLGSVRTSWRLRGQQKLGRPTRHGTFLTPTALVQAGESDTTIIPPGRFLGLDGRTVRYRFKDAEKSYRLPAAFVNATPEQVHAAISQWLSRARQ